MHSRDEELSGFEKWISCLHSTIKFSMDNNPEGIPFLDTFLTNRGQDMDKTLHKKDRHLTLHTSTELPTTTLDKGHPILTGHKNKMNMYPHK